MASSTTYGDWMRPIAGGIRNIGKPLTFAGLGVLVVTLMLSMVNVVAAIATAVIGIGTIVGHIRDLARAYKEAQVAIDVGKVFDTEKYIISYENLGIGRLIEAKHYLMLVKAAILVVLIHHKRFSTVPPINIIR